MGSSKKTFIVRYSEIVLKGENKANFEKRLVENIKRFAKQENCSFKTKRLRSRIILELDKEIDLRRVFGIASYSPYKKINADLKTISSEVLEIIKKNPKAKTFRISAKRLTKDFPLSSPEINTKLGALVVEKMGLKVKLENSDLDIGVEIIDGDAFIFTQATPCFGGLPVGIEGKIFALVADEKSFLAPLLLMRRGCYVEVVSLKKINTALLDAYNPRSLSLNIIKGISELKNLAQEKYCKALVVPDTLENMREYPVELPVLRPLIAFSESEISEELEKYKSIL